MLLPDLHSAAASADLAQLRQHWWLNKHRINGHNRDKQTPLHLACINGHADVVQFLVEKKCKLNPCDKLNKSPLMKAVEHQNRDCAAILLEHGADPNRKAVSGNTALHFAVMVSSKSLVELLLEHGADIDAKNKLGYTPLTLAITENCEEMVKFLLQKGADVNTQDNVFRTPLRVATVSGNKKAVQLLLHHGAVFPESNKGLHPSQTSTKMVKNYVIANEQIGSSCYETTPVIPLETPELEESCDVPKEKAAEKKDSGPAANQNKVSVRTITRQAYRGYKAEGPEKKEDKFHLWNPKPNSEVPDKAAASMLHPGGIYRTFLEPSVTKGSIKGTWKAAGAAKEGHYGSLCNPKHLSGLRDKAINPVQRPAGERSRVGMRSAAEECGKGDLKLAGGAAKEEDTDSSLDSEADPKGQGKVWTSPWLSAANTNRLDARSAAVERGKGGFLAASVEAEKEDGDSSWDSEPFSEIVQEVFAGKQCPAADCKAVGVCSAAVESIEGVLQPAGGTEEDDDSPWDSEIDSGDEGKGSAAVQLPAANINRLDAHSVELERGKGVLKEACREEIHEDRVLQAAGREAEQEDNDSPWDSETDSEGEEKVPVNVRLSAADQERVGMSCAAAQHIKGVLKEACREEIHEDRVLQAAGREAEQEDNDSPWDSETDSEGEEKVPVNVRLSAADQERVGMSCAAAQHIKGVLKEACREEIHEDRVLQAAGREAEQEDNDSPWDSETDSEGEEKVPVNVRLSAADQERVGMSCAAAQHIKGVLKEACREEIHEDRVLQAAGREAEQEDNDSPWDSETDSEGEEKVPVNVRLSAADQERVGMSCAAAQHIKAARAEPEEHFIPSPENKLPTIQRNDIPIKVESSTETDSEQEKQFPTLQREDLRLKVYSSTQTDSEQEKQLKDLKEPFHKSDYYTESGKNALKEKKVITVLRNMQGHLVGSSAAAIPQQDEHIQWLQIQMARLEATVQQQVKTIEVFETVRQVSHSSTLRAFPVHDPQSLVPYSCE